MPQETNGTAPSTGATLATCGDEQPDSTRSLVRDILDRVGDRWTLLVIRHLVDGPTRFTALQNAVSGISHRMLTRTLRTLERDGLVSRAAYAEVPPRVEYALTPLGQTLIPPVTALIEWVGGHQDEVEASRMRFDA